MANGHGGARPGAGRKRKTTLVEQASRRGIVLEVIDDTEWRETVKAWLVLAKDTPSVIYPLLPYLLGGAKQTIEVTGEVEHRHVELGNARAVLRVVGGTSR
jgi:hypothetical protein